jgi:hypothetical protein
LQVPVVSDRNSYDRSDVGPPFLLARCVVLISLAATPLAKANLVGYWSFDSAGELGKDFSGSGADLSVVGGATYSASGKQGGALSLNGSSGYLTGAVPGLPIGNSAYTVAAWIKPTSSGARGIVGWGNYTVTRQVNAFRLNGANGFSHYWWSADLLASDAQVTAKGVTLLGGQWVHVATVYNGTTRAIYLNGQLLVSDTPGINVRQVQILPSAGPFPAATSTSPDYWMMCRDLESRARCDRDCRSRRRRVTGSRSADRFFLRRQDERI